MSVARSLERRLEHLLERVAGKVFSGRLHPSEIAGKLAREADFARFEHQTGPATANRYLIRVHPGDLTVDAAELEGALATEMSRYAAEEGLRLEGPVLVSIDATRDAAPGSVSIHVEVSPGEPVIWARLVGEGVQRDIGRNRVLIGRGNEADVRLSHDDVSRRHAVIWREHGSAWVADLGSANGTTVDGASLGSDPAEINGGSVIGFSAHRYRFTEV